MKIKINAKTGSIYTGTIKNTYPSTFRSYIKEQYWQLISTCTEQLWSVPNCLIQVPNCPVPITEMSNSLPTCPMHYRLVQVSTEMSRYRIVQVPRCLGFKYLHCVVDNLRKWKPNEITLKEYPGKWNLWAGWMQSLMGITTQKKIWNLTPGRGGTR